MNKYVEAFNTLVNGFCCECRWTLGDKDCERYACLKKVNTLKELVEKATQKAPSLYQDYDLEKEFWECPTCGQALDWSGEDE